MQPESLNAAISKQLHTSLVILTCITLFFFCKTEQIFQMATARENIFSKTCNQNMTINKCIIGAQLKLVFCQQQSYLYSLPISTSHIYCTHEGVLPPLKNPNVLNKHADSRPSLQNTRRSWNTRWAARSTEVPLFTHSRQFTRFSFFQLKIIGLCHLPI